MFPLGDKFKCRLGGWVAATNSRAPAVMSRFSPRPLFRPQDCNFHECAKLDEFESMRQLSFTPPDGEFVLLNYRINAEFRCPFRLFPSIGDIDPYR